MMGRKQRVSSHVVSGICCYCWRRWCSRTSCVGLLVGLSVFGVVVVVPIVDAFILPSNQNTHRKSRTTRIPIDRQTDILSLSGSVAASKSEMNPHTIIKHGKSSRHKIRRKQDQVVLFSSPQKLDGDLEEDDNNDDDGYEIDSIHDNDVDDISDMDGDVLKNSLSKIKSLEDIMNELDEYCAIEGNCEGDVDDEYNDMFDIEDIDDELISLLSQTNAFVDLDIEQEDDDDADDETLLAAIGLKKDKDIDISGSDLLINDDSKSFQQASLEMLEKALLGGVVPPNAGVATDVLPGDFGFDPLNMAEKDYIHLGQYWLLSVVPGGNPNNDPPPAPRPTALVLRDYREAEIRHGRLACMAVIFWPLQEKLDKLLLDDDQFGPIMFGPTTLPYFPLLMTLIMMLLGYLDIYAKSIQEEEQIGDAFLPGDCFWDPLRILEGAPPSMKRNMQERELFNCRMAMLAFAAFVFEEVTSHQAVIDIPSNALLFEPLYQVSFVQEWLDQQFS